MIRWLLILNIIFFASCNKASQIFDKKFYIKITGIALPSSYEIIETYDSGEFVATTTLKIRASILKDFIAKNKLKPLSNIHPGLFGYIYLKGPKPNYNLRTEYYIAGDRGKNHWIYLVDIKEGLLWAEIIYPDWADN